MIRKIATLIALTLILTSCNGDGKEIKRPEIKQKTYKNLISKVERFLEKESIGENLYKYDENNRVIEITNIQRLNGEKVLKSAVSYSKDKILIEEDVLPEAESNLSAPTKHEIVLDASGKAAMQVTTLYFAGGKEEQRVADEFRYNEKGRQISQKTPTFRAIERTWANDNCIQKDQIYYPSNSSGENSSVFFFYTDKENNDTYPDLNQIWSPAPSIEALFADELGLRSFKLLKDIEYTDTHIPAKSISYEFDSMGRVVLITVVRKSKTGTYPRSIYKISYKG